MSILINNLTKKFNTLVVLENLTAVFEENSINCILGPSGCGKTTLLNIMCGLLDYDSGILTGLSDKKFSYIFQEDRLLPWCTVLENILFVLESHYSKEEALKIALIHIDMVGLKDYKDYYENELSGGMKRRVSIARAFSYPFDILIMDEPFKGLDLELKM